MRSHRAGRQAYEASADHDTEDSAAIPVSLRMSRAAASRFRAFLGRDNNRFVIVSSDGALSVRASVVIARRSSTEEVVRGLDNATIDWDSGTIEHERRTAALSRTELRLLARLLEGAGSVVPHAELITAAWSSTPDDAGYNILAVYICYLRRGLKQIGLGGTLRTVRGSGYLLAVTAPADDTSRSARRRGRGKAAARGGRIHG